VASEKKKRPVKVRGFLGEQSFEITEGWTLMMEAVAEAMVYNSIYRSEREKGEPARIARMNARDAVRSFRGADGSIDE
jgi:hypothetical protein